MATQRIFWEDPYLGSVEARVMAVDGYVVTLDRTVAFASSGGQASDAGTIGGHRIVEARADGAEIRYTLPAGHGLTAGQPVLVEIDWPTRYRVMRLHFAAELVLELVNQRYGQPEKLGANITPDKARVDFVWDGDISEVLPDIDAGLRCLVVADLPIVSGFSDQSAERRYWRIDGFATVPCGGTHLRRTSEIGSVSLRRVNPGKGKERIEILLRS